MNNLDDFDILLKNKAKNDTCEVPDILNKKIDNLLMNLPNKKRSKNKILKVAFIAATISTVLATTTVMAATPEIRNLVGSVISYFNNNDTRYSADKTNFEKFNKAVGVSSYDKNIKFTVNNIAVDDNFINVFLTIESKDPVSINKTGKDELFESQFSTPFLDFKVNGKTLKASNNNDTDAYFEDGKKVLKSMVRFNVSQVTLPETFNLEISTNNICNVKGTWKIQTSVDKSKVIVNSKTVKPNINKTISINGIKDELAIDKILMSPFGNQIVLSEKNSRGTITPFALFDDRGISLDILNTDTVGPINGKSTNSFEFLKANLNTKYIDLVPINYLNYEGSKNEIDLEKQPISKLPITFKTSTIGSTIVDKISYDKNSIRVTYHKDGVTLFDPEFEFFDANGNIILDNGGGESTSIDRKDGTYTEILTFVNKTVDFSKVAQIRPIGKMQQLELLKDQKIRIKTN